MAKKTLASLEKQLNEMQEYAEDLEDRLSEINEISRPAEDEEDGGGVIDPEADRAKLDKEDVDEVEKEEDKG